MSEGQGFLVDDNTRHDFEEWIKASRPRMKRPTFLLLEPTMSSPLKNSARTPEQNLTAAHSHHIAKREIAPVPLPEWQFWSSNLPSAAVLSAPECTQITDQIHKIKDTKNEEKLYVPIVTMLNILSMAQARANAGVQPREVMDAFPTVVHLANPNQGLFGDAHDTGHQPDIVMAIRPYAYVRDYLEKLEGGHILKLDDSRPCLSALVAVAEIKTAEDGSHQLLSYLDTVKRYRPDINRVYGLFGRKAGFTIYQLTPCQASRLTVRPEDKRGIHSWNNPAAVSILQQFITATYAQPILYGILELKPKTTQVWTFIHGNERWNIVPFYAAHGPGRMTWVAVAFKDALENIQRIFKLYWADERLRSQEVDLYETAHGQAQKIDIHPGPEEGTEQVAKRSWLGGLARVQGHWNVGEEIVGQVHLQSSELPITRQLVGLLLGSSGKPLNFLKTDVDMLKCMYDLLESKCSRTMAPSYLMVILALQRMNENGVLHRDISYGNVFCYPKHYIDGEEVGDVTGCIDSVLLV